MMFHEYHPWSEILVYFLYMAEKTEKRRVGDIGEGIAERFLVKLGYSIIQRNYWKPYGEIDIIAKKSGRIHFCEVKTVSRRTNGLDSFRPEDNVHAAKLKRIGRTIQTYIIEHRMSEDWQFDVITVELNENEKTARVQVIDDLVLPE